MDANERRRRWIAGIVLAAVLVAAAIACVRIGEPITALARDPARFQAWVAEKGWTARIIFVGMVCVQVILAVIPGEPLELAAGYAFGALEGTILTLAGIVLGSVIVFGLVRVFGMKLVEVFFSREKIHSLRIMRNQKRLFIVTAVLMILPGTPKDLLTYCVGLTEIPFGAWLLICSVGRIPSVITSTLCGHAIGDGNYAMAAIVFGITALLCGAGLYVYARMKK